MKCRIDIIGRKIWNDNNNAYRTRPPSTEIRLLRDGEVYKTETIDSDGDGIYRFICEILWPNSGHKYQYKIDEPDVPEVYTKTIVGYNVINTLGLFTLRGVKTWADNHNEKGQRPASITVNLLQNGVQLRTIAVPTPPNEQETAPFSFDAVPFTDTEGKPFVYTVTEAPVEHYTTIINGFNITNNPVVVP